MGNVTFLLLLKCDPLICCPELPAPSERKTGSSTHHYQLWAHSSASLCKTFHCFHPWSSHVGSPANSRKPCHWYHPWHYMLLFLVRNCKLIIFIHCNTLFLVTDFATNHIKSMTLCLSSCLLQTAGIHIPLGRSEWIHRRKDGVPESCKGWNR